MASKGGFAPGYNVQLSTDAAAKIIVGVGVSQAAADAAELIPAVARIEAQLGEKPKQMVVDNLGLPISRRLRRWPPSPSI